MITIKISIGDSTMGYTTALVNKASTGRYTLVRGSVNGHVYLAKSAVRGLNEDSHNPSAITSGGDYLSVRVEAYHD